MKENIKKNKNLPLVTVITPTYNRASLLGETISSVINQDYPKIEYIVLDDGSTDGTRKIIGKFKDKLIYEYHENIGEVLTVNKGFKMAHGEIMGVVNSDDPLLPGAISEVVKYMTKNPEIIVVYPDWVKIGENGNEIEKVITSEYSLEYMLSKHDNITGPGTFFRKKILDKIQGRDARFKYVSDYDFWLRAGLIGKFARIPKILSTSRVHKGQLTLKNKGFSMAMEHIRVINKIFSLPDLPASIKKVKSKAYKKACEAARSCRGDKLSTKILISFVCLYYSPFSYLKIFTAYRLTKLQRLLRLIKGLIYGMFTWNH